MAKKRYASISILPLEFPDGQQVEAGEEFERDFAETTGEAHEQWLIRLGHIREVVPVPAPPTRTVASAKSKVTEDNDVNDRTD